MPSAATRGEPEIVLPGAQALGCEAAGVDNHGIGIDSKRSRGAGGGASVRIIHEKPLFRGAWIVVKEFYIGVERAADCSVWLHDGILPGFR